MTGENRKANAAEHLDHAERFLQAADLLAAAGLFDRATSQAYYALYHTVCALLVTEGLEARSHRGAQHLLNVHFIRAGLLGREHLATLAELQREREEADYMAASTNDSALYHELRARVERARAAIRELLAERGVAGA